MQEFNTNFFNFTGDKKSVQFSPDIPADVRKHHSPTMKGAGILTRDRSKNTPNMTIITRMFLESPPTKPQCRNPS